MNDKYIVTPLKASNKVQLETSGRRTILNKDEAIDLADELTKAAESVSGHTQTISLDEWKPDVDKY